MELLLSKYHFSPGMEYRPGVLPQEAIFGGAYIYIFFYHLLSSAYVILTFEVMTCSQMELELCMDLNSAPSQLLLSQNVLSL